MEGEFNDQGNTAQREVWTDVLVHGLHQILKRKVHLISSCTGELQGEWATLNLKEVGAGSQY